MKHADRAVYYQSEKKTRVRNNKLIFSRKCSPNELVVNVIANRTYSEISQFYDLMVFIQLKLTLASNTILNDVKVHNNICALLIVEMDNAIVLIAKLA